MLTILSKLINEKVTLHSRTRATHQLQLADTDSHHRRSSQLENSLADNIGRIRGARQNLSPAPFGLILTGSPLPNRNLRILIVRGPTHVCSSLSVNFEFTRHWLSVRSCSTCNHLRIYVLDWPKTNRSNFRAFCAMGRFSILTSRFRILAFATVTRSESAFVTRTTMCLSLDLIHVISQCQEYREL